MTKITTEVDGKKYELVSDECICSACALYYKKRSIMRECAPKFNGYAICGKLAAVWKEVRDAD